MVWLGESFLEVDPVGLVEGKPPGANVTENRGYLREQFREGAVGILSWAVVVIWNVPMSLHGQYCLNPFRSFGIQLN